MISYLQERMNRAKADDGFTLIELLIVIIILGILAAVVIFSINGLDDRGETAACRTDLRIIRTAQEAHYAQAGQYALDGDALEAAGFLDDYVLADALHATAGIDGTPVDSDLDDYTVTGQNGCP